ncbi:unnamed protein product [Knipowitschia caucasica]
MDMEPTTPAPGTPKPPGALLQNRVFLDLFWDLSKPEQDVRLRAVDGLVTYLKDHNKEEELEYTLKRLVDGLSHSRETARPAFSLALGQVLSAFADISLLQTLNRIKDKHNLLTVKKKLQRNAMFGNLFGVLALHQSGRLTQEPEVVLACVQLLQSLTPHRQHLRDLPSKTMMDILNQVEEDVFEQVLFTALQSDLSTPFRTPEQLHLLLVALQRFPQTLKPKKLKKLLGFSTIIHQDNVPRLTELLKTVANSVKKERVLPPVMVDLLKLSLKENSFQLLWSKVISEGLLKEPPGPSHYLSFRLLGAALPLLSEAQLKEVLRGEVARQYGQHMITSQKAGRFQLSPEMEVLVSSFLEGCDDVDRQVAVVLGFSALSCQGCPVTAPSWRVMQHLRPPALLAFVSWLQSSFLQPQLTSLLDVNGKTPKDDKERQAWVHRLRKWIAARLVALVDNQQLKKEESTVMEVSRFLMFHAFFSSRSVCAAVPESSQQLSVPLQDETTAALASSFFSLLLALHHLPQAQEQSLEDGAPVRRVLGVRADGTMWISHLFDFAQSLLQQQQIQPGSAFGPPQREAWDSLLVSVSSLKKKMKKSATPENKAFLQLFLLVAMYLFKAPDELLDIIRDLQSCVERAHKKKRRSSPGEEQEPAWVEVLVELLLSLLSQPSRHIRQVCKMVFSSVCPHVTQPALSAILKVLEPEPDEEEDGGVLVTDEEPGLGKAEEEEEEGSDSDDEEGDEEEEEEEDEEDGDADDDEDENEEEAQEEVDPEFRLRLMKVLEKQNALAKEEDSSGDEDLDDEAMMKLDQSLASVFSEQKKKNQAKKEEKSKLKKEKVLIRDFKIKVLDLVEVFVSRQSSSPLVLSLVQPLLTLIQKCMGSERELHEQDLLRRAAHVLRNELFRAKVYCRSVEDRASELHELLESLLNKALKLHDSSVALYYFSACLYLLKVLRGAPPSTGSDQDPADNVRFMGLVDLPRVVPPFRSALCSFFSRRKSPLTTQMFSDLFTRFPVLCVELLDTAVENMTAGVREHQQGQACVLVLRALQSREVQLLTSGEAWTQLCSRVTGQLVLSVQQCASQQKALKDKLQQVLDLCLCVQGHAHRQKLPVALEPLQASLQELSSSCSFSKTGRVEDTYWAVMKKFGVMKPKSEKTKPNPEVQTLKTVPKKKKGFLPESKKRKKRKVLETTDATANIQPREKSEGKKASGKMGGGKKAGKRPAGAAPAQDSPSKKTKLPNKKKGNKGKE